MSVSVSEGVSEGVTHLESEVSSCVMRPVNQANDADPAHIRQLIWHT